MKKSIFIIFVLTLFSMLQACVAHDRDNNPPGKRGGYGTNWENPPGPVGGPGTSPNRKKLRINGKTVSFKLSSEGFYFHPSYGYWHTKYGWWNQSRQCWFDPDGNPPGRKGGAGTNWENPPGMKGGPGTSPDKFGRC